MSPDNGGSPITGFIVSVRQADGSTFTVDEANCEMSASLENSCTIPEGVLRAAPYDLGYGSSVFAKVIAINSYGNSAESEEGNGAVIITAPSEPLSLSNQAEVTSAS